MHPLQRTSQRLTEGASRGWGPAESGRSSAPPWGPGAPARVLLYRDLCFRVIVLASEGLGADPFRGTAAQPILDFLVTKGRSGGPAVMRPRDRGDEGEECRSGSSAGRGVYR
jgi:hypothetical protein